jgi:hypothetical protein
MVTEIDKPGWRMQPGSFEMQIADQSSYDVALEISGDWALRLQR